MKYRYGSPGLLTHDKWIALPRRMALGWNHASLNYRVFQQNSWKADVQVEVMTGKVNSCPKRAFYNTHILYILYPRRKDNDRGIYIIFIVSVMRRI